MNGIFGNGRYANVRATVMWPAQGHHGRVTFGGTLLRGSARATERGDQNVNAL
jgi:hypothetical protein